MTEQGAARRFGLVVVDELVRCGVTDACLAPGSRSAPLALALANHDRIRLHVRIDERSAAFTALGLAKASRRAVVVLSTSGTAAANFHPAVIEADLSLVPLVVITADRPPELRATGANQTIDQVKLYGDSMRSFIEMEAPEPTGASAYWRSATARAVAAALSTSRGPVHINAPLREPLVRNGDTGPSDLGGRPAGAPWHRAVTAPTAAPDDDAAELAARLSATERGLIVAGDCDIDPTPWLELARRVRWPIVAEPSSNLRASDDAVSTYEALLRSGWGDLHPPELVLRVGKCSLSRNLEPYLALAEQIAVDASGRWLDPARSVSELVVADPSVFAGQLLEATEARADSAWQKSWMRAEATARRALDEVLDSYSEVTEPGAARAVAGWMPDGSTLVVASSMPVRDLDYAMHPRAGTRVLANRGASGIDGFVSTAMGVALASHGPTVALAGDLSMIHDANGLLTTHGPRPDVTFVVINNDGGGIFSFLPQAAFPDSFEAVFGTPHGVDFEQFARVYGCGHQAPKSIDELIGSLDRAARNPGVDIVVMETDRAANVVVHGAMWDAVTTALQ